MAYEQFPLSEKEILKKNYRWFNDLERNYKATLNSQDIPDDISKITKSILNETIGCEHKGFCAHQCTKAFRIIPEELQFYQRMNLPLPRICPNCRYFLRLKRALPWRLWHRSCMCNSKIHSHKGKCEIEFKTSYSPNRPEIVYCKDCYQKEFL